MPQFTTDIEPGFAGQHRVEHQQVELAGGCAGEAGGTVEREFDAMTFGAVQVGDRHDQTGFVFDQQNASVHWILKSAAERVWARPPRELSLMTEPRATSVIAAIHGIGEIDVSDAGCCVVRFERRPEFAGNGPGT